MTGGAAATRVQDALRQPRGMSMNLDPLERRRLLEGTVPRRRERLDELERPDFPHTPDTEFERRVLVDELDQDQEELDRLRAWAE